MISGREKPLQFLKGQIIRGAGLVYIRNLVIPFMILVQESDDFPVALREIVGHTEVMGTVDREILVPVIVIDQKPLGIDHVQFLVVFFLMMYDVFLDPVYLHLPRAIGNPGDFAGPAQIPPGKKRLEISEAEIVIFAGDINQGTAVHTFEIIANKVNYPPALIGQSPFEILLFGYTDRESFIPVFGIKQESHFIDAAFLIFVFEVLHSSVLPVKRQ